MAQAPINRWFQSEEYVGHGGWWWHTEQILKALKKTLADSKTIILPKTMWENHWFKQTIFPKKLGRTFWFRQLPAPSFPTAGAPTKPVAWGQVKIKQPVTSGDDLDLPHEDFADPKNLWKIWQNHVTLKAFWSIFRLLLNCSYQFFKVSPIKIHMIPF